MRRITPLIVLAIVALVAIGAHALTAPDFVAQNLGTTKVKVFKVRCGDTPYGAFECYAGDQAASFVFRSGASGAPVIIKPRRGFAAGDTCITLDPGQTATFYFKRPYPDWVTVTTSSTNARVWAE